MIDLKDFSSLPLYFDTKSEKVVLGEGILCNTSHTIPLKKLIPGLLNKSLVYPENVYDEHQTVRFEDHNHLFGQQVNGIDYDILYLPEGLLGVEFIKSHVYYSPNGTSHGVASNVIEVFVGTLTILLQRNVHDDEPRFETEVEDGLVVRVKKGERAVLPKGYYYTFINTGETPVIFSRTHRNRAIIDYSLLKKEQGMAYYFIRKNAKCEVVKNPRYGQVPKLRKMSAIDTLNEYKFCDNSPVYSQILNEVNMFIDMLWA